MNRWLAAVVTTSAFALMLGCAPATTASDTHDADVAALKENEAQWNKDFAAKDLDKLAAHYADDAVLMTPGSPSATGKDAVRAELKSMLADPALALKFQAARVEVSKSGDMASTQGSYEMTMTNPATKKPMNDKGSYVTVYKKQDGSWKAVSDIATSEVPPVPAEKK